MVCSRCPTPKPIKGQMKLCRIVCCSYCIPTQICIGFCVKLSVSVSVSVSVSGSMNTPLWFIIFQLFLCRKREAFAQISINTRKQSSRIRTARFCGSGRVGYPGQEVYPTPHGYPSPGHPTPPERTRDQGPGRDLAPEIPYRLLL